MVGGIIKTLALFTAYALTCFAYALTGYALDTRTPTYTPTRVSIAGKES